MVACHAVDPGSSPGQCKSFFAFPFFFGDCLLSKEKREKVKRVDNRQLVSIQNQEKTHLVFVFFFAFLFLLHDCFFVVFTDFLCASFFLAHFWCSVVHHHPFLVFLPK